MAQDVRRTSYDYVMLAEAAQQQRWANLYAVVVECSIPRPTRGTGGLRVSSTFKMQEQAQKSACSADMISNLRLVDPSTATNPQYPEGLEMLAFSTQQHHLPTLRRSGDIIRLHRVTVRNKTDTCVSILDECMATRCLFGFR